MERFQTKNIVIEGKKTEPGSWELLVDGRYFYVTDAVFNSLFEKEYKVEIQDQINQG